MYSRRPKSATVYQATHNLRTCQHLLGHKSIASTAYYRKFFAWYGIHSSEDLNNITNAMRVRVEARRQLKILQK